MAAPSIVGTITTKVFSGTNAQSSYNIPLAQNTTAGSQLVLLSNAFVQSNAYYDINGSSGNPTTNNNDTSSAESFGGNPFVAANSSTVYAALEVYRFASVTAGSSSVTVNYKNAGNVAANQCFLEIAILELSGMAASPLDQTNFSALAATQSISITTTAGTGDIYLAQFVSGAGSQSGAGWTQIPATLMYYQTQSANANITFTTTGGTDPYTEMILAYAGPSQAMINGPLIALGLPIA